MKVFLAAALTASALSFGIAPTVAFAQAASTPSTTTGNANAGTGSGGHDKIHAKMANKACKGMKKMGANGTKCHM